MSVVFYHSNTRLRLLYLLNVFVVEKFKNQFKSFNNLPRISWDEDTSCVVAPTLPLMTELATATAAVAVMTLGIEKAGNVASDDNDTEVSARGSDLIVCGFAFGKVK